MTVKMLQDRFASYRCTTRQEIENAMGEIAQEIALAGLSRSDFFGRAGFQGGTCLRILYGMPRFSEDLDFLLKGADPRFRLDPFFRHIEAEFRSYGVDVLMKERSKADATVRKAFLKSDSLGSVLMVRNLGLDGRLKTVRIKFEVDTNPPFGSGFETRYLDFPFPFPITAQDLPSLFAGKSHALLTRAYTKGRDWYDFVWYVGRKIPLNYGFLSSALDQLGPWRGQGIQVAKEWYLHEMGRKIDSIDWNEARQDIERFLRPQDQQNVSFWSRDYFLDRLEKMKDYLD